MTPGDVLRGHFIVANYKARWTCLKTLCKAVKAEDLKYNADL